MMPHIFVIFYHIHSTSLPMIMMPHIFAIFYCIHSMIMMPHIFATFHQIHSISLPMIIFIVSYYNTPCIFMGKICFNFIMTENRIRSWRDSHLSGGFRGRISPPPPPRVQKNFNTTNTMTLARHWIN